MDSQERLGIVVSAIVLLFFPPTTPRCAAANLEARALTGSDGSLGPGLGTGVTFSYFSFPVINGLGQTAFTSGLSGSGIDQSNDTGLWTEDSGQPALIAREGASAPGTGSGVNFGPFDLTNHAINDAGQVAITANLVGSSVGGNNNSGLWSGSPGVGLALVAREGSHAPGTSAKFGDFVLDPLLNGAGQTAFSNLSLPAAGSGGSGIWSEGGGSGLALVARVGDQAPGTIAAFTGIGEPVFNGAGQTAFQAFLNTGPSNNKGIWSEGAGGGLALVARGGSQAPGTIAGTNFTVFAFPDINDAGQVAFYAGDTTGEHGIWSEGGGSGLALVARSGMAAPGTDVQFDDFNEPIINGQGQTAFRGTLSGVGVDSTNDRGIWSQTQDSGLELIAREGSPAPSVGSGVTFESINFNVLMNNVGQVAFTGSFAGAVNGTGLWATGQDGLLQLIVRTGELLDVNSDPLIDDFRTVSSIAVLNSIGTGGQDGRPNPFNDDGQIAMRLQFTDGSSGIFVATIPEPMTLILLGLGASILICRRRSSEIQR